jgi:hypothetical protein
MFALLALIAAASAGPPPGAAAVPAAPPIELRLNGGDYRPGDGVNVEVATGEDGYLLVFRVDGDGYIRVLFPLDPDLDAFVRGGRRYALRGRSDEVSFLADDRGGTGTILAVLAREPFAVGDYAAGGHWDYERLRLEDPYGDVEAQLLGVIRRMTDNGRFDYDVLGYRVWGPGYESEQPVVVAGGGWADPYFNTCLACGWRSPGFGISIGTGWYDPWYDPWFGGGFGFGWNSWRNPYGFNNYGAGNWNGWWGWDPYWGTPYRPITVINTPRRPIVPNPIYGTRARVPQGASGTPVGTGRRLTDPGTRPQPSPSGDTRSRDRAQPAPSGSGARPSTSSGGASSAPRPSTPAPSSGGRSRGRPNELAVPTPASPRVGGVETRRTGDRPVYRPPTPTSSPRVAPSQTNRGTRPASSPPPRREATPRTPTSVPQRSAQPSRSAPRSAPAPSSRPAPSRSPSPSAGRSSPAPSAPAPSRSRGRGPD